MTRPPLNSGVSLYLDLARISAAVLVLLHHVFEPPFYDGGIHFPGRSGVIVFFVISGFVIAYATDGQSDWRRYAVARLARIYSVALPALALTGVLYATQVLLFPGDVLHIFDQPAQRLVISALFLGQSWNLTVAALTNGPYWSLCYEVWYYALFGVVCFLRGWLRWAAVAAVALLVGPRILLLLPIWVLGVLLYHAMKRLPNVLNRGGGSVLFLIFLSAFVAALVGFNPADRLSAAVVRGLDDGGYWLIGPFRIFLGGDARFPSDYLLAMLFAATVVFCKSLFSGAAESSRRGGAAIRLASSYTFSLYLFHAPLLVFLNPILKRLLPTGWLPGVTIALIVLVVVVLGRLTEHRKDPYTRLFGSLCARLAPRGA